MAATPFQLLSPADPRLAVTVRTFVASSTRYLGVDPDVGEDLRLAASELFAAASDGDSASIEIRIEAGSDHVTLTAVGVPDLAGRSDDLPLIRRDLLLTLFPDLRHDDGTVVIRAAVGRT